jgi:cell filamentation protein
VTFDPFGDFAARGYLRNLAKAKDPDIVPGFSTTHS